MTRSFGRSEAQRLAMTFVGFCGSMLASAVAETTDVTVDELRCEYHVDPLGIDVVEPRLSWVLRSSQRGQKQTAYRVLVAGSLDSLSGDTGDLWDSGKVTSDQSAHVVYAGKPLESRVRCYWKVRVWDSGARPSNWSAPARWTMGLLNETDWKAEWIGLDTAEQNDDPELHLPPSPYLRKTFDVNRNLRRATVYVTALGLFELSINGRRVGRDLFTPGWTNYDKRVYYMTYDVTDLLAEGRNAVGAILAPGWYSGYVGFALLTGYPKPRGIYGQRPALRMQLECEYADGRRERIVTDEGWKASTGPIRGTDILMGETYDARRAMPGWDQTTFDDSAWQGVAKTAPAKGILEAYPGVPVRATEEIRPVAITEPKKGVYVFNLGQNFAGRVRLKVKGEAGTRVVLRFAEMLHRDGTIMTENLRKARCTDTYVLRGESQPEIWESQFTYHGFQYVEVTGYPGKPDRDAITGVVLGSDTPVAGAFECSSDLVNKLYRNITWTQRANFFEVPTDCPQRDERLGWTGDAQIYIRSATYNMDVAAFFTKWLVALTDDQRPYGAFPDYAPWPYAHGKDYSPGWMDAGVICPYTMYKVYGDKRVLRRHYGPMKRFMDFLLSHSKDYLRPADGNSYGDWLSVGGETPKDLIATAYFAYDASLMAEIAAAIGHPDDARGYRELFEHVKAAFNRAYVSAEGRIKGDTQTGYTLALSMNLLPEHLRAKAGNRLVELIRENNGRMATGFIGTKPLLGVLTDLGEINLAYRLLTSTSYPSWGYSIVNGSTTIWERWNSFTKEDGFADPGMNSFSHYAFGAVCEWMFSTLAGIDTDGPGYKRIRIRPRIGGDRITFTRASYDSIHGRIATDWRLDEGTFRLDVTLPANTTATVHVPTTDPNGVTEGGRPAEQAQGVQRLAGENDAAVFRVGSGSYSFAAPIAP